MKTFDHDEDFSAGPEGPVMYGDNTDKIREGIGQTAGPDIFPFGDDESNL